MSPRLGDMSVAVKDMFVRNQEDGIVPGQGPDSPRRTDDTMEMAEVIRQRRNELGLSQVELATRVGTDKRQIGRYESGETHPALPMAVKIAEALGITVDELAGRTVHRVDLSGDWWASWQTSKDGQEVITLQEVRIGQRGNTLAVQTATRGIAVEEGGYHWTGEFRLWDNEILMGWYAAADGSVRSKGTMYFVLHPHGQRMSGRWVGLSYDGDIMTGWAAITREKNEAPETIHQLKESGGRRVG